MLGIVTCDVCEKQFAIGPNRIHGSRVTDLKAAEALTIMLEDDRVNQPHRNSYEIHD